MLFDRILEAIALSVTPSFAMEQFHVAGMVLLRIAKDPLGFGLQAILAQLGIPVMRPDGERGHTPWAQSRAAGFTINELIALLYVAGVVKIVVDVIWALWWCVRGWRQQARAQGSRRAAVGQQQAGQQCS